MVKPLEVKDFRVGERVVYVPDHARGDAKHPNCERGYVTALGTSYVFVRYSENQWPKATDPSHLVKEEE